MSNWSTTLVVLAAVDMDMVVLAAVPLLAGSGLVEVLAEALGARDEDGRRVGRGDEG